MKTRVTIVVAVVLMGVVAYLAWPRTDGIERADLAERRSSTPTATATHVSTHAESVGFTDTNVPDPSAEPEAETRDASTTEDGDRAVPEGADPDRAVPEGGVLFFCRLVSASDGQPLGGQYVLFQETPHKAGRRVRTDPQGCFSVASRFLPCSSIRSQVDGYEQICIRCSPDHQTVSTALEIRLCRAARLWGHVVRPDGEPVANVAVVLVPGGTPMDDTYLYKVVQEPWSGVTDRSGAFEIDGITAGIPLVPRIVRPGAKPPRNEPLSERTAGLFDGPWIQDSIRVQTHMLEPPLAQDEVREVRWIVPQGTTIRGRVVDQNGAPLARYRCLLVDPPYPSRYFGFELDAVVGRARTDDAGSFRIEDVPVGRWLLGVRPEASVGEERPSEVAPWGTWIDVPQGGGEISTRITVYRGVSISGRVQVPEDVRDPVTVQAVRDGVGTDGVFRAFADCERDGSFVIGPLIPGSYDLSASRTHHDAESATLLVPAGATDVVLHLVPLARASISGQVVHRETREMAGPRCEIQAVSCPSRTGSVQPIQGWVEESGRFGLSVQPGTYHIVATTDYGRIGCLRDVSVAAGAELHGLCIELNQGGFLHVRPPAARRGFLRVAVVSQSFPGPLVYSFDSNRQTMTVPCGVLKVSLEQGYFVEGEWRVRVLSDKTVRVAPGQTVAVAFE